MMGLGQQKQLNDLLDKIKVDTPQSTLSDFPLQTPDSAEEWINKLPSTNPVSTAVELYKALPQLTGLAIDPKLKRELLDIFFPVVLSCSRHLLRNPLNKESAKAVSLSQALLKQLYEGYKLLVYDFGNVMRKSDEQEDRQQLAESVHHAIHLLSHLQLNSLGLYLGQPRFLWRDLHTLYQIACKLEVQDDVIAAREMQDASIHRLYVKLLLLSCARPNHFSRHELNFVFQELDFWSSLATLEPGSKGALFLVDPGSDMPPVYLDEATSTEGAYTLDTSALVEFLNNIVEGKSDKNLFSDRISRRVIKDLTQQWGVKLQRKHTHIKDNAKVMLAFGLTSSVCMLSKTDSFEQFLHLCGQKNRDSEAVKAARSGDSSDVWSDAFDAARGQSVNPSDPIVYTPGEKKAAARLVLMRGIRVNTSLNGACVEILDDHGEMAQPGAAISVRAKGSNDWSAGIVRWKHVTPTLNTVCGIHFPSKVTVPAAIRGYTRDRTGDQRFLKAVLFAKNEDLNSDLSLICAPLRFKAGAKITVLTLHKKFNVLLSEEVETTEHLAHFRVELC